LLDRRKHSYKLEELVRQSWPLAMSSPEMLAPLQLLSWMCLLATVRKWFVLGQRMAQHHSQSLLPIRPVSTALSMAHFSRRTVCVCIWKFVVVAIIVVIPA
jgi:hypothetical protein